MKKNILTLMLFKLEKENDKKIKLKKHMGSNETTALQKWVILHKNITKNLEPE